MDDLVYRLKKRADIRRSIPRGEPDRISDILEEAAKEIETLRGIVHEYLDTGLGNNHKE